MKSVVVEKEKRKNVFSVSLNPVTKTNYLEDLSLIMLVQFVLNH